MGAIYSKSELKTSFTMTFAILVATALCCNKHTLDLAATLVTCELQLNKVGSAQAAVKAGENTRLHILIFLPECGGIITEHTMPNKLHPACWSLLCQHCFQHQFIGGSLRRLLQ